MRIMTKWLIIYTCVMIFIVMMSCSLLLSLDLTNVMLMRSSFIRYDYNFDMTLRHVFNHMTLITWFRHYIVFLFKSKFFEIIDNVSTTMRYDDDKMRFDHCFNASMFNINYNHDFVYNKLFALVSLKLEEIS